MGKVRLLIGVSLLIPLFFIPSVRNHREHNTTMQFFVNMEKKTVFIPRYIIENKDDHDKNLCDPKMIIEGPDIDPKIVMAGPDIDPGMLIPPPGLKYRN